MSIVQKTLDIKIVTNANKEISVLIPLKTDETGFIRMNIPHNGYFVRSGGVYTLATSDIVNLLVKANALLNTNPATQLWSFREVSSNWSAIETAIIMLHQRHADIIPSCIEFHSQWADVTLREIRWFCEQFQQLQKRFPDHQMDIVGDDMTTESFLLLAEKEDPRAFAEQLYERYKTQWLLSHGYTLQDVIIAMEDYRLDLIENEDAEPESDIRVLYEQWQDERGFDSQIWACFPEFCMCELRDKDYMNMLLTAQEHQKYQRLLFEDMQYK